MFVWLVVGGGNQALQMTDVVLVEDWHSVEGGTDQFLFSHDLPESDEHAVWYSERFTLDKGMFDSYRRAFLKGTEDSMKWPRRHPDGVTWCCTCGEVIKELDNKTPRTLLEMIYVSFRWHVDGTTSLSSSEVQQIRPSSFVGV